MNRVIKFRGKRIDNGQWVYGYYSTSIEKGDNGGTECNYRETCVELHYINNKLVYPNTVGQYIGIEDDNKKELYDGDIVTVIKDITVHEKGYLDREVPIEINYVVVFDLEELDFKATNGKEDYGNNFKYLSCCEDELIKVGNKFDNPELLEQNTSF